MLRIMESKDLTKVEEMIRKIHLHAYYYFQRGKDRNQSETYIYDTPNQYGVVSKIEEEDFVVIYTVFSEGEIDYNVIYEIDEYINQVIEAYAPKKPIYLNIYQLNKQIVKHFRDKHFQSDMEGIELTYNSPIYRPNLGEMTITGYQDVRQDDYITLLDAAFYSIDKKTGSTNYFNKHKTYYINQFKQADQHENFGGCYLNNQLVGLYLLHDNYIQDIAIDPKFQRKGLGTTLLQYCLDLLINKRHYNEVILRTEMINHTAQQFYLKNQFHITGRFAEHTYKP